jgi:UDP-GlcNAc:undecaprenyl-phosphate GlcNAc-1-phosphate transferase
MMEYSGLALNDLGDLLGFGSITLGYFAIPVTVVAILGAINAFNMVDGIDGLLGGLSLVTFTSIAILMKWSAQPNKLYISILFIAAIIPFILINLGVFGRKRKVFMGDAGSMMIGFTVIWLLLGASQSSMSGISISPVTCLWLVAVPLMDMVSIIIRRLKTGRSPFKPDRDHLHHILQNLGYNSLSVLLIICCFASLLASLGVASQILNVLEKTMFLTFILLFIIYHHTVSSFSEKWKEQYQDKIN